MTITITKEEFNMIMQAVVCEHLKRETAKDLIGEEEYRKLWIKLYDMAKEC